MGYQVRNIDESELGAWVRQRGIGFLNREHEETAEFIRPTVDLERTWAAFDGSKLVGSLRSFANRLTVPGPASVPAAALTNVTVAPTHRRRGLLTEMILADLRHSAELGEAVGILIASEYPIYGRYGYGPAIDSARYSVSTVGLRFCRPSEGSVELVELDELHAVAPGVYERFRAAQPGSIDRHPHWWDRTLRQVEVPGMDPHKGFSALYRSPAGDPEGYVRYTGKQDWDGMSPRGTLELEELVATTGAAYQALWEYCCNVDLVTTVEAATRPVDELLPLLVNDARLAKQVERYDFVWVRVLDTRLALAGRRYAVEGRLVLEVVDGAGLAGGRFVLEGGPEGASCTASDETAELTFPVDSLGSVYAGGVPVSRLVAAGRVEEHVPGAAARADLMFSSAPVPWCATWF
jgi:predicted acetyltransferase